MALFRNRPLAAACMLLVLTVFFGFFLPLKVLAVALLCVLVCFAVLLLHTLRRSLSHRRLCLLLLLGAFLLGGGRVWLFLRQASSWEKDMQTTAHAELRVIEVKSTSAYSSVMLVEVERFAGKERRGNAVLRCEYPSPFLQNDRIEGEFTLQEPESDLLYPYEKYVYLSQGVQVSLYSESAETLKLTESGNHSLSVAIRDLRARLSLRISSLFSAEEGNLLSAMLLGDRDALGSETVRDFRRVGVSHLLAISGLHLMVLVGFLDRVLYLLHAERRVRICLMLPACVLYVILTGCQYSMIRSACMLIFVYAAFLLRRKQDSLTSLLLIAAFFLLLAPETVFDPSYQMTMLATFGLLSFSKIQAVMANRIPQGKGITRPLLFLLRFVLSSLLVTLSVSIAVLPVLWLVFGELSLFTPLANLLLVPLATPVLVGALLLLLLPLRPLAVCVGAVARLLLFIVGLLAKQNCVLSLRYGFVPYIFIPLLCLTAIFLLVDLKKRGFFVYLPTALAILAFSVCLAASNAANEGRLQVVYRNTGTNEGLVLCQNGRAIICDSSNGSQSQLRANYALAGELCATRVEALMLTHYHERHVYAISAFSKDVILCELWLPTPRSESDLEIYARLLRLAAQQGIVVKTFSFDEPLALFEKGSVTLGAPLYEKRSSQPSFSLSVAYGEQTLCYHAASFDEFARNAQHPHSCAPDHLILGSHGPVPRAELVQTPPLHTTVIVGSKTLLPLLTLPPHAYRVILPSRYQAVLE